MPTIYYSPSSNGFFDPRITPDVPEDGIALTEEQVVALLQGQSEGLQITAIDGVVTLVERPATVPQSVTAAQFGMALIEADLMDAFQAAADAAPAAVKWAWARETAWARESPTLAYLAEHAVPAVNAAKMDELFTSAAATVV